MILPARDTPVLAALLVEKMMNLRASLLFSALLLTLSPLPAAAQQSVYGYGATRDDDAAPAARADTVMETRLSDLETQIRTLNGRLEQAEWQNKKLQSQLDRLQGDLDMRLSALEHAGGNNVVAAVAAPAPAPAPVVSPVAGLSTPPTPSLSLQNRKPLPLAASGRPPADEDAIGSLANNAADPNAVDDRPPAQPVTGKLGNLYMAGSQIKGADQQAVKPVLPKTPADYGLNAQEQYDRAFGLLRSADYEGAEAAFKGFISKNPKDSMVDNAKYWLGETYYARNQFDASAVAFADAYQSAPKGSKAPDSLLKLGLSLSGLKKTDDACTTLAEVTSRYPNAPASVKTRTEQEMKKLKCKN